MQQSSADAFDAFYRSEWSRLAGTLRLMGGASIADEVAQEAMTRAWVRWHRVSAMQRPEGWLYVTAFRLLRRRLAREAARPAEVLRDSGPSLDLALTDRISLQRALASLPIKKRQAVVARYVLGLDGPRASELLGLRPDAFRKLLSRAMEDLRTSHELLEEA